MPDTVDTLMIDVRASTRGFEEDVQAMRGTLDGTLIDGFGKAGQVLERGLLSAIRRGSLGFEDLKRIALNVIDEIAMQAVQRLFDSLGGLGGIAGGIGGGLPGLGGFFGSLLGLPGRATGGPVSPGRGYVVGERGPELFVPTSAGRIETSQRPQRDVRIAITINSPAGGSAPQALQRSSRQVASAVRRALSGF
jgi:hypothetical protein